MRNILIFRDNFSIRSRSCSPFFLFFFSFFSFLRYKRHRKFTYSRTISRRVCFENSLQLPDLCTFYLLRDVYDRDKLSGLTISFFFFLFRCIASKRKETTRCVNDLDFRFSSFLSLFFFLSFFVSSKRSFHSPFSNYLRRATSLVICTE